MKKILTSLALAAFCLSARAQSDTNAAPKGGISSAYQSISDLWDLHGTNGLAQASTFDLAPIVLWSPDGDRIGGGLRAGYWVTDQQGANLTYVEFGDRSARWDVGYAARTFFKQLEVSFGTGVSQPTDGNLGEVTVYLEPALKYPVKLGSVELDVASGVKIIASQKPEVWLGLNFRFGRN